MGGEKLWHFEGVNGMFSPCERRSRSKNLTSMDLYAIIRISMQSGIPHGNADYSLRILGLKDSLKFLAIGDPKNKKKS